MEFGMADKVHSSSGFFPPLSLQEDESSSGFDSSDEEHDDLLPAAAENHDGRTCRQALAVFTTITCASFLLSVILFDSVEAKMADSWTNSLIYRLSHKYKRPKYTPGERAEHFLLCTVGSGAKEHRVYPPDGLCNWIIYTHVSFDARNNSLVPTNLKSWKYFLGVRSLYNLSGLLPSHEWGNFSLPMHQAQILNRTLTELRMVGLAFLNVRIGVDEVRDLAAALATLANANPSMFLVLGVSFRRLNDRTASELLPSWLLDKLVTSLSVFVLETHLPPPADSCTAGFSTALQPVYGQKHISLTFRGARAFLEQPALRYASPHHLARCVSVMAGALVYHVVEGHRAMLGAPCTHWSLEKLASFCRLPTVTNHEEARSAFGWTNSSFFSYEFTLHIWSKIRPALHSMLLSELPTCLAVYALDLDASPSLCSFSHERTNRLVYTAYDAMRTMMINSSYDSLFAVGDVGNSTNSTL